MVQENRERIGRSIRRHREALGWTQEQVAAMSGYKAVTVDKIERGVLSVNLDVLQRICDVLNVHIGIMEG